MGQKQTSRHVRVTSVIPLKADIHQRGLHVRLVPEANIVGRRSRDLAYLPRGEVAMAIAMAPSPTPSSARPA